MVTATNKSVPGEHGRGQLCLIRVIDIAAALLGGLLVLPIILILWFVIRLDTPGPSIFRQQRVGRGERLFVCCKLRTMAHGAPAVGSHEIPSTYVTALGRRLRRLKLDELPQLWNVLIGEMSLVGPRPCLPSQKELIAARRALGVYGVRPGITGSAQVKGIDMSTPLELAHEDAVWVAAPSLKMYASLVVMTVFGRGRGDAIRP